MQGWPQELLDQMYLDEDSFSLGTSTGEGEEDETKSYH
jgi:protein PhnA